MFPTQEYDEDFEEELESSSDTEAEVQETPPTDPTHQGGLGTVDLVEIMQAIDMENRQLAEWEQTERQQEVRSPSPTHIHHHTPARTSYVDFSAAREKEERQEVAQKTRRRGQVSWLLDACTP